MPHVRGDEEIKVSGSVLLGEELQLVEFAAQDTLPESEGLTYTPGRPSSEVTGRSDFPYSAAEAVGGRRFATRLAPTGRKIYLRDQGLTLAYGIIGAPGTGKTPFYLNILRQLLALTRDPERKFGALILDPKAALIESIRGIAADIGRADDVRVINAEELRSRKESHNIIDAGLEPSELTHLLVLAASSVGVRTTEPFWRLGLTNLLGGTIALLAYDKGRTPTLREIVDATAPAGGGDPPPRDLLSDTFPLEGGVPGPETMIQRLARSTQGKLGELPDGIRTDLEAAIRSVDSFYSLEPRATSTVMTMFQRAFADFHLDRYTPYCTPPESRRKHRPIYDDIIEDGLIVLVAPSPAERSMARSIATIMKLLFQQTVLSRLSRVQTGTTLTNWKRPLVLACDEYAQVATELEGEEGDGNFFSAARQYGCMGLMAMQSVDLLATSGLGSAWPAVFSMFNGKIFLRVEGRTAEEAAKLGGKYDYTMISQTESHGGERTSITTQRQVQQRSGIETSVVTQLFKQGQGVFIGTPDNVNAGLWFLQAAFESPIDAGDATIPKDHTVEREPEAGAPVGTHVCEDCIYYRPPRRLHLSSAGDRLSPKLLQYLNRIDEEDRRLIQEEDARYRAGGEFDYRPHSLAWCALFTAEREHQGVRMIDPTTGESHVKYALCARMNPEDKCDKYTPKNEGGSP